MTEMSGTWLIYTLWATSGCFVMATVVKALFSEHTLTAAKRARG